jgi:HK97 family phage major capsid protein
MRLGRLADERERTNEKLGDLIQNAEDEQRDLGEFENEQIAKYRTRIEELDVEIELLAGDLERDSKTRDVSALLRDDQRTAIEIGPNGPVVYRTFAAYARDEMIARWPQLARMAVTQQSDVPVIQEQARERLMRVQNTLTSDVAGLLPPTHLTEIMDIISGSRPVVTSARGVPLTSGQLTYPRITGRPSVTKQTSEKTEAGTAKMSVVMDTMNAETYLGGGDLSWQTINWGTPDALQLWFTLAAEAYARATETRACNELGTASGGTISTPLGTTGTESFDAWRAAILAGLRTIYANTGGRQQSNTLWVAANRFFALAGTGTANVLQTSSVGQLDIATMTGVYSGLRVIGSYGFADNTAVIGDSGAFLVGETPGAPVELRVVEPAIGGMECGVIGAFQCKVFDTNRFIHLS